MQDPVGSFIRYIETTRRYSPNTVASYRRDIDRLLAYLGVTEETFDPARLTADEVRAWVISLSEEGLKPTSINRMLSAWGSFYKYLLREEAVVADPFRKVSALKKPMTLPAFIPESRMSRLVNELAAEMDEGEDFCRRRDALMVLFLYATGLRLAELIAIDRTDFEKGFRELHVRGKGDKERIVPIVPELRERIQGKVPRSRLAAGERARRRHRGVRHRCLRGHPRPLACGEGGRVLPERRHRHGHGADRQGGPEGRYRGRRLPLQGAQQDETRPLEGPIPPLTGIETAQSLKPSPARTP